MFYTERVIGRDYYAIADILDRRNSVKRLRPLLPKRCCLTNKWLWLKPAVRTRRILTGPGDPIVLEHWIAAPAYTLLVLTRS